MQQVQKAKMHYWLVSTPLKNISKLGLLFPIFLKVIKMFPSTHQNIQKTLRKSNTAAWEIPEPTGGFNGKIIYK